MSIINDWCERMEKIKGKLGHSTYIEQHCPYRRDYFCNGRPNRSKKGETPQKKPVCKHFKNGRCELELHLGKVKTDD